MFASSETLIVVFTALAGGAAGRLIRSPGGALLLATVAVAAVSNVFGFAHLVPSGLVLVIQVLVGCMLGQSINRNFWQDFLLIWKPCVVVILLYSVVSVPFALLLVRIFGFDPMAAVLSANPARIQDMIILAGSLGLDAVMVMLIQLCRQFAIIGITPFILTKYVNRGKDAQKKRKGGQCQLPFGAGLRQKIFDYAILLIPAGAGSILGKFSGLVLGPLLGAFAAVAISRLVWSKAGNVAFPTSFAFVIQCLAGILLGVRITPETGALVVNRAAPLVAAILFVLAAGLFIAAILHRCFGWHKGLAWMAAAPGKSSEMLAISQDMDLTARDRLALACVHTVRQVYFTLFVSAITVFL